MENGLLYETVVYRDKRLRAKCCDVETIGEAEKEIFVRMYLSMKKYNGVGYAAPQAGILKNMFVAEVDGQAVFMANPRIEAYAGLDRFEEGCLSVPGITVNIERPLKVTVTGINQDNKAATLEAEGLLARVIQHETDHLKGKLIIDYMPLFEKIKLGIRGKAK